MTMERIVRPFQLPAVTPPHRIIEGEKPVENVVVDIGKAGSGFTFTYNLFFFENFDVKDEDSKVHNEVSRKESTRRITNPDDADQHVDTKVLDEVKVRNASNPKDYSTYRFTNPNP